MSDPWLPWLKLYAVEFGNSFGGIIAAEDIDSAKSKALSLIGFLDENDYIVNVPGMTSIKSRETVAKLVAMNQEDAVIPSGIEFLPGIMYFVYNAKAGEHWCFETTDSKLEFTILPTIDDVHSVLDTCRINKKYLWFCSDWSEYLDEL